MLAWAITVSRAADGPATWQLELWPHSPAAVFDVDKDAYLTATVRNVTGVGPDAKLVFAVTDDGAVLSSGEVTVSASAWADMSDAAPRWRGRDTAA